MEQERRACASCGAIGIVNSICEYCGTIIKVPIPVLSEEEYGEVRKKSAPAKLSVEKISKYQTVGSYNGKLAVVSIGKLFGLINKKGDLVVNLEYDNIDDDLKIEGLFAVYNDGKCALLNDDGKFLTGFQFGSIKGGCSEQIHNDETTGSYMPTSVLLAWLNRKIALMDEVGTILTEFKYDDVVVLEDAKSDVYNPNKLIKVAIGQKWGLINFLGEEILPCDYDKINAFHRENNILKYDKYILLSRQNKLIIFDLELGESVLPDEYDYVPQSNSVLAYHVVVRNKNNKSGIYDISTKKDVLPCAYNEIKIENRWVAVRLNKWGVIKMTGEEVVPFLYDKIEYNGNNELKLYYGKRELGRTKLFLTITMDGDTIVKGDSPKVLGCGILTVALISFGYALVLLSSSTEPPLTYWFLSLPLIYCIVAPPMCRKYKIKV